MISLKNTRINDGVLVVMKKDFATFNPDKILSEMDNHTYTYDLDENNGYTAKAWRHNMISTSKTLQLNTLIITIAVDLALKNIFITHSTADVYKSILYVYNKFIKELGFNIVNKYTMDLDVDYYKYMCRLIDDHSYFFPQ